MTTQARKATTVAVQPMRADRIRQLLVILALAVTIAVNGLANALPINGLQTGDISDRFQVYFVPAGYVFAIWGLIYLALIGYGVYQARPSLGADRALRSIGYLFVLSSVANIIWIFLWHYEQFPLTLPVMLVLLGSLVAIYRQLAAQPIRGQADRWFVHVPFRIYLGWITVATIANATTWLDYLAWSGWGIAPTAWAVIMMVIAAGVGTVFALVRRDAAYVLVLIWALTGIAVKHSGVTSVAWSAWLLSVLLALALLWGALRRWQERDRGLVAAH